MVGYVCIGGTEIQNAYAFRKAARKLGYYYTDVILNANEYGQVDMYIKKDRDIDINKLLDLGRQILKEDNWL